MMMDMHLVHVFSELCDSMYSSLTYNLLCKGLNQLRSLGFLSMSVMLSKDM